MMEYVWIIEYWHPDMQKGQWNWIAVCDSEATAQNWWEPQINDKHRWYRRAGRLYCQTHYTGGESVSYRITRTPLYCKKDVVLKAS